MARRIILLIGICCIVMIASTVAIPKAQATEDSGQLVTDFSMTGTYRTKFPHIAAANGYVYAGGNVNKTYAVAWKKVDSAHSFASYTQLGSATGSKPDYATVSVAIGPDGTTYYAWTDPPNNRVYVRTMSASGNLGPIQAIDGGTSYPVSAKVGVTTDNQVFVVWRVPDNPLQLRRSTDGGVSWTGRSDINNHDPYGETFDLAAGPDGEMAVSYYSQQSGLLRVYTGIWNSGTSKFDVSQVSSSNDNYADSSITYSPDGTLYTSWRGVDESGSHSGVFYSERKSDGSWPVSHITTGTVFGKVNIDSDESGNLNFAWISKESGTYQIFYLLKPAGDSFRNIIASNSTGTLFNPHAAASISSNGSFEHVVYERFDGSTPYAYYALFKYDSQAYSGTPLIESGAATVGGKTSVSVSFTDLVGVTASTTQVRWRWNAAPTDSDSDSSGWQTYANPLTVAIPTSILEDTSCGASTLYTQLRDTSSDRTQETAASDSITIDGVVQGAAEVYNPYLSTTTSTASTSEIQAELTSSGATSAGDPKYTRLPFIYLNAVDEGDCTGITTISYGKSLNSWTKTYISEGTGYSGLVSLPDIANLTPGYTQPVVVQIADGAGNTSNYTFNITYDDENPTLVSADQPTATANTHGDILQDLQFTNVTVTDTYTQGSGSLQRHFWGVWLANSTTDVSNPLTNTSLKWTAVAAPQTGADFTISNWSLATGLSSVPTDGTSRTYYIYGRFLDGAGNPSTSTPLKITVTSTMTQPKLSLPMIQQ
ncbi:MAG: hypothetical protein HGA19_00195 [Oscillochloris sp.]|nr:hypothetical protein [Oscillochloris sp.]